ncbi:MAG: hypothetical protein COT16_03140 [Elusimicrobia bacterium CG08_land_8_20_14_0_20_44_26]|nr:MAG: hypothetical protein COT16_03140 [Elusimicrobia bacterium CG08_land_8_20_14_0_20_44_26]
MQSRELLIANLKKQIEDLEKIPKSLRKAQNGIKLLIDQLQDESKTGTPPNYDLGADEYRVLLYTILGELKKNAKILIKTGDLIISMQKEANKERPSETQEFDS